MIGRRHILATVAAIIAWPLSGYGQQPNSVRRLGVLLPGSDAAAASPLIGALQTLGWVEGRNIILDVRAGRGEPEVLRRYAAELAMRKPDVLFGASGPAARALKQEAGNIPIVFTSVTDPVGRGFAASLARPGGNMTGFSDFDLSMGTKWLQVLKDIAPQVGRVALVANPASTIFPIDAQAWQAAARSIGVVPIAAPVRDTQEIEVAVADLAREPGGALLVLADPFNSAHRTLLIGLAARHRLPAIYVGRPFAEAGGLVSYGIDRAEQIRRAASYIDRVLKGEAPANLPIQEPTKFELVINLGTARALGLTIPPSLLARADEVIE